MIKTEFTPVASLITPDAEFQDGGRTCVDPTLVTPLHLESVNTCGWLYTRDEWENDRKPRIYRRFNEYEGLGDGERVELLPDVWVVKIDERQYWVDEMVLRCTKIVGVYVVDRRQLTYCCSMTPSYWLHFLGTQWEGDFTDAEREEIDERVRAGDSESESNYYDVANIDRILTNECRPGFLPETSGGYKIEVSAVVSDDAIAEVEEAYCQSEL